MHMLMWTCTGPDVLRTKIFGRCRRSQHSSGGICHSRDSGGRGCMQGPATILQPHHQALTSHAKHQSRRQASPAAHTAAQEPAAACETAHASTPQQPAHTTRHQSYCPSQCPAAQLPVLSQACSAGRSASPMAPSPATLTCRTAWAHHPIPPQCCQQASLEAAPCYKAPQSPTPLHSRAGATATPCSCDSTSCQGPQSSTGRPCQASAGQSSLVPGPTTDHTAAIIWQAWQIRPNIIDHASQHRPTST